MTALSEDLQAFLEAERDIDAPPVVARERLLERLEPLLLVPVALAAASAVTTASASSAADSVGSAVAGALKAKIAAAVVSAVLVGGAVGAGGHAYLAAPPPPAVAPVTRGPSTALPRAPEPAPPAHDEPAEAAPAPAVVAEPSVGPARPERPRPAGSLRAERLLIETASAALMRGDPASAVVALRQHARQFPKGDLVEEREVLLKKALAASGGGAAAEKRAKDSK
jgi:hypothetical protein